MVSSGLDVPGWESVAPSATFADGRLSGFAGCNRFNAANELDGDRLELADIAMTRMACPRRDAVESAYVKKLEAIAGWRAVDDELVLLDADGAELVRLREPALEGAWTATAFLQGDGVSSPITGTEVTATSARMAHWPDPPAATPPRDISCGSGDVRITGITSGAKACTSPEGIMEQEQAYLDALPHARRFQLDGVTLTLLTGEGTIVATYTLS